MGQHGCERLAAAAFATIGVEPLLRPRRREDPYRALPVTLLYPGDGTPVGVLDEVAIEAGVGLLWILEGKCLVAHFGLQSGQSQP